MDFITAPFVLGIIFYFTYRIFELFVRKSERISLIEKIGQNNALCFDPLELKNPFNSLFQPPREKSFIGMRIGCLLVGLGLGLLTGLLIVLSIEASLPGDLWQRQSIYSVAYGASVLFFGGLGLIISYMIENKLSKKKNDTP
jgi:hypothetical protein